MERVTTQQLRGLVEGIELCANQLNLLEGGEWLDIPDHLKGSRYEFPHLVLDEGSPTYGRAWRLNGQGGSRYKTAHFDPLHLGSGYLGSTKREAYVALRSLLNGLATACNVVMREHQGVN